jgi:CHAT domain-containing protein
MGPSRPAGRAQGSLNSRVSRDLRGSAAHFARLPGTRVEGERVGRLLGVSPWLGPAVLEAPLRSCRSPRLLHLSTHGFFLEDQVLERGRDDRGPGGLGLQGGSPTGRLPDHRLENPLLRSGLALAGANTWLRGGTPPARAEDGILTAEDVSGMDLLTTELVVLSACQTGLGEVHVGEGVYGLRRAFLLAGASTVIMSLWKVDDLATVVLMERLYQNLLSGGMSRDRALREAQRATRNATIGQIRAEWLSPDIIERLAAGDDAARRRLRYLAGKPDSHRPFEHPFFWAAFICQGEPGPLP